MISEKQLLDENGVNALLERAAVGRLATINSDGSPYVVPVNFVYYNSKIYIHGSMRGRKAENIKMDSRVCFEVDEMSGIIIKENRTDSCGVTTGYESVVAFGQAVMLEDMSIKKDVLQKTVEKYAPEIVGREMPEAKIAITAVIEISITQMTEKHG